MNNNVLLIAFAFFLQHLSLNAHSSEALSSLAIKNVDYYTCSMHPHIRMDDPNGKCPICGMSLIPVESSPLSENSELRLEMSESAAKLANIQTSTVKRDFPKVEVRLFGNVDFDETLVTDITAYFPGRIERLFVNYEGISVNKGDHLAEIYSPELITAQQELKEAITSEQLSRKGPSYSTKAAKENLDAARDKLRLWGLSAEQIKKIEKSNELMERLTIYSPQNGIVIKQNVQEGHYLKTGEKIYRVASLDRLWVKLEAYESQLPWLRYGQSVSFTTDAHPGETFEGKIAFISPTIDQIKRTAAVRVNLKNANQHLKPGLFVRATVQSATSSEGLIVDEALKDKWVCPMHPEVIEKEPGTCHLCGMDLVSSGKLIDFNSNHSTPPLVIPKTAPLITGKRAVVYVKVPNTDVPTFESREIVLGAKAGDVYIVKSGLKENEAVVTKGAFKIDSAMQISAKLSMMNSSSVPTSNSSAMDNHSHNH